MRLETLLSIRILGDRLLLHREPVPERSRGGIYIIGREYPALAQVLKVGNAVTEDIVVGDHVTFGRYEFEKWVVIPEYAIIPLDSCEMRIRGLV